MYSYDCGSGSKMDHPLTWGSLVQSLTLPDCMLKCCAIYPKLLLMAGVQVCVGVSDEKVGILYKSPLPLVYEWIIADLGCNARWVGQRTRKVLHKCSLCTIHYVFHRGVLPSFQVTVCSHERSRDHRNALLPADHSVVSVLKIQPKTQPCLRQHRDREALTSGRSFL